MNFFTSDYFLASAACLVGGIVLGSIVGWNGCHYWHNRPKRSKSPRYVSLPIAANNRDFDRLTSGAETFTCDRR